MEAKCIKSATNRKMFILVQIGLKEETADPLLQRQVSSS